MESLTISRGDIVLVDLQTGKGSEQGGMRPAVVIQNDVSNKYSSTTIVAPLTSKFYMKEYPTNVEVTAEESGLHVDSTILLNQIRTIDKSRIIKKISCLSSEVMSKVDIAIKVSLGLE